MKSHRDLENALEWNGFQLKRIGKSKIYSNGTLMHSVPLTPSCHRAWQNNYTSLKNAIKQAGQAFIDEAPQKQKEKEVETIGQSISNAVLRAQTRPQLEQKKRHFDRDAINFCIKAREDRKDQAWMAEELTKMGYVNERGTPFTQGTLSHKLIKNGVRMHGQKPRTSRKQQKASTSYPTNTLSARKKRNKISLVERVMDIVSSNLSEDNKEEMIIYIVTKHLEE